MTITHPLQGVHVELERLLFQTLKKLDGIGGRGRIDLQKDVNRCNSNSNTGYSEYSSQAGQDSLLFSFKWLLSSLPLAGTAHAITS
jgi:hypothetical protein